MDELWNLFTLTDGPATCPLEITAVGRSRVCDPSFIEKLGHGLIQEYLQSRPPIESRLDFSLLFSFALLADQEGKIHATKEAIMEFMVSNRDLTGDVYDRVIRAYAPQFGVTEDRIQADLKWPRHWPRVEDAGV